MRIVCISDTHRRHRELSIPYGDVLVHSGDIGLERSDAVGVNILWDFTEWLSSLPHSRKVVIAGNHDFFAETSPAVVADSFKNIDYLLDSEVVIDGIKFYGSPWQPTFYDWAFNLDRGKAIAEKWKKIPDNTDVLITHGPPCGILDNTPRGQRVGCYDLLERIHNLQLRAHVFGHIHHAYGVTKANGTYFVNACVCDEMYEPVNEPIVIDIWKGANDDR